MTTRKKILATATMLLAAVGLVGIFSPFILSLAPTRFPTEIALPLDLSKMQPYSSSLVMLQDSEKRETSNATEWVSGSAAIVIQLEKDNYSVFVLPTWEGSVVMPEKYWGQHGGYCKDFVADFELSQMKCIAKEGWEAAYRSESWFWSFQGKNVTGDLPDLNEVEHSFQDSKLYIARYHG